MICEKKVGFTVNRASYLCLNVEGASTVDGAVFTGCTDQEQANQRFQIESQSDVFVPIVPTAEQGTSVQWRYTTNSPRLGWNEEGLDDRGWAQGLGGFGEGDDRGNIGTLWNTRDIWLRKSFDLPAPLPSDAGLRIFHDEGVEVDINGVLVFNDGSWVSGHLQTEIGSSANAALHVGANLIAVHCRNTVSPQYIDLGFSSYAWDP